jgi:hypothetical protein
MTQKEIIDALFSLQNRDDQLAGQMDTLLATAKAGLLAIWRLNDPDATITNASLILYHQNKADLPTPPPYSDLKIEVGGSQLAASAYQVDDYTVTLAEPPSGPVRVSYSHKGVLPMVVRLLSAFPELGAGPFEAKLTYWNDVIQTGSALLARRPP